MTRSCGIFEHLMYEFSLIPASKFFIQVDKSFTIIFIKKSTKHIVKMTLFNYENQSSQHKAVKNFKQAGLHNLKNAESCDYRNLMIQIEEKM